MPGRNCVLLAADDASHAAIVREVLEQAHYRVLVAGDGLQALEIAHAERPDLLILGVTLPSLNGFELCSRLRSDPELRTLPIIMLTSFNEPPYRIRAEQVGVSRFMAAPFDRHELLTTVRTLLDRRKWQAQLVPFQETVRCLLIALQHRAPEVFSHSQRVACLAGDVGRSLLLDEEQVQELVLGALLHDIGKLGLTGDGTDSWEPVYHAVIGARMLCRFRGPTLCAVVRSHHEHLNGTGGPDGLAGEDLALPVRIVAICNRFDRLTGGTPGRQRKAREGLEALKIEVDAGLWDPRVAEHLREVVLRSARLSEAVAAAGRR